MNLFKNYDDEFKKLKSEIGTLKSRIATHSDRNVIKLESLEEKVNEMDISVRHMTMEFIELKQMLQNQQPTGLVEEEVKIATLEKEPLLNDKGKSHISTYKQFENFALPRSYDMKFQKFFIDRTRGGRMYLNLNFHQLRAIIRGYQNDLKPAQMRKTNPILKKFTSGAINSYLMYWRAGAFNQAIMDTARKLGYNPEHLISHECDDL